MHRLLPRLLGVTVLALLFSFLSAASVAADPVVEDSERPEGLLGPFVFTDAHGVPLDHYDITADEGGWSDWDNKLLITLTNGAFTAARMLIGATIWLLNWAFTFAPAEMIVDPARQVAQTFQTGVIDRLGLPAVFLLFGAAWCGVQMLRGRVSRGAGELAVSVLIAAVAATVLARPADLLLGENGLLGQTRDTALALTAITVTHGESASTSPEQAAQPLNEVLVHTFVVQPHMALNYGLVLDEGHACHQTYRDLVAEGPWGTDPEPRSRLTAAGGECAELAEYNTDPSMDRLFGAYLLLGAVSVVCLLVLLLVCVLLIAVLAMGVYVVCCPVALVAALLPGGGRQLLWRWLGGVVKTVLSIVAVCLFLAVFTLGVQALMDASSGMPLVGRFALLVITALGGLAYHRTLLNAGSRAGQRLARGLEAARVGGTRGKGWMGPTGASSTALSPVSATGLARLARSEANRVAVPVRAVGRAAGKAWAGSAAGRRKAHSRLAPDASGLRRRLAQSRGGRVLLGAGKAAAVAGTVAFGSTIGAPIAVPKAAAAVKTAARARTVATKTKLAAAAVNTVATTRGLADAWGSVPPVSTARGAAARALAADADATRTRDLLSQRPPVPRYAPAHPGHRSNNSGRTVEAVTVHSPTPPAEEHDGGGGQSTAERLREQIRSRRRPRRPGGR